MRRSVDLWHPTRTLTRWLTALLVLQAVGHVAGAGQGMPRSLDRMAGAFNALVNGHDALARRRFQHASDGTSFNILQFAGYVGLAVLVLVIIWQWRSQTNARALGRTGARISPGWGIAGWLIPLANYVIPYLAFQDLWRSSDPNSRPGTEWRTQPGSPMVTAWWIAFVVGSFVPIAAIGLVLGTSASTSDLDSYVRAAYVAGAAACLLEIFVLHTINQRQEHLQEVAPAPTELSFVVGQGLGSGGPGWYPDPLARFEHRYWDGHLWTEWVSTEGQLAIDTEPVPGYD